MRVLAVDPGETIGLAWYDTDTEEFSVTQVDDVWEAEDWIWAETIEFMGDLVFLIEDYNSAGYMTKSAYNTVKVLGRIHGYMERDWGCLTNLVPPQARLSSVDQATEMLGENVKTMHRNGRDAIAALAHALSYARENDGSRD